MNFSEQNMIDELNKLLSKFIGKPITTELKEKIVKEIQEWIASK